MLPLSPQFFVSLLTGLIVVHVILGATAYLIFLERKVAAWTQDRTGPNRTNFSFGLLPFKGKHFGLGQALADGLKLLVKEEYNPPNVDRLLFLLAPAMVVIPAIIGWAVIPWGGSWLFPGFEIGDTLLVAPGIVSVAVAPVSVGVVYILAIGSLAVYGVVVGAYASNNKYSFLGGLRATAQMLSYEIPMGLCVLIMIIVFATTDAGLMVNLQGQTGLVDGAWGIFYHPLLAIIFFICVLAECNRAPFDLAEAEQELVGGFHTEYSSMKWALFFLGEYMHMITGSAFFVVLFLGGWDLSPFFGVMPILAEDAGGILIVLAKAAIFAAKVGLLLFIMMWIRWTLPRFRFDQLMKLAWRGMIPLTLVMLIAVALMTAIGLRAWWWHLIVDVTVMVTAALVSPLLPQGPAVNRRVPLEGSRFSPATT